ncbi:unnamed protein product [Diamesa serratosioi]
MMKMHSRCFFMALLSTIVVTQSVVGFPISDFDGSGEELSQIEVKQVPVISDIERIKKIVQVLEFVGDKVIPLIIENFPAPLTQPPAPIIVDSNETGLTIFNNLKKGIHERKVLDES